MTEIFGISQSDKLHFQKPIQYEWRLLRRLKLTQPINDIRFNQFDCYIGPNWIKNKP